MSHWRATKSVLRRLREVGPGRVGLLLQTFVYLLSAKLALKMIPVERIIAWKMRQGLVAATASPAEVEAVRWAVLVVSRWSPVPFVCFPQCLAAAELLRGRGMQSRLHYGVTRSPDGLLTHTWLECGGDVVIGGEVADGFSTLAVY